MIKVFVGNDSVHDIEIKCIRRPRDTKWYNVCVDGEIVGIYPSKTSAAMGIADYIFDFEVCRY